MVHRGWISSAWQFASLATLSRYLSLRIGYGLTSANYDYLVNGRNYQHHNIDTGVDYSRDLSLTRRTKLAFSTGAAAIREGETTRYDVIGSASLNREIGRTWNAVAAYSRNAGFIETIGAADLLRQHQRVDRRLISNRLSFRAGAGASRGNVGYTTSSSDARRLRHGHRIRGAGACIDAQSGAGPELHLLPIQLRRRRGVRHSSATQGQSPQRQRHAQRVGADLQARKETECYPVRPTSPRTSSRSCVRRIWLLLVPVAVVGAIVRSRGAQAARQVPVRDRDPRGPATGARELRAIDGHDTHRGPSAVAQPGDHEPDAARENHPGFQSLRQTHVRPGSWRTSSSRCGGTSTSRSSAAMPSKSVTSATTRVPSCMSPNGWGRCSSTRASAIARRSPKTRATFSSSSSRRHGSDWSSTKRSSRSTGSSIAGQLPSQLDSNLQALQGVQLQIQNLVESIEPRPRGQLVLAAPDRRPRAARRPRPRQANQRRRTMTALRRWRSNWRSPRSNLDRTADPAETGSSRRQEGGRTGSRPGVEGRGRRSGTPLTPVTPAAPWAYVALPTPPGLPDGAGIAGATDRQQAGRGAEAPGADRQLSGARRGRAPSVSPR